VTASNAAGAASIGLAITVNHTAGTFAIMDGLVIGRRDATATLLADGSVLVAGGRSGTDGIAHGIVNRFDPSGVFTYASGLRAARFGHEAVLLQDQRVLIVGGGDTFGGVNWVANYVGSTAEVYDPTGIGSSNLTAPMSVIRLKPTATLLPSGKVLVAGGRTGPSAVDAELSSAELYDPDAGTFATTGSMSAARSWPTATLLGNGKVLVVGGWDGSAALASAELYDPETGTFTATGTLGAGRYYHTATRLPSGEVLVVGGHQGVYPQTGVPPAPLDSAEIYDPLTGLWRSTGSLVTGRRQHAAALLNDGRVLVVGGYQALKTAELYR
jgi:hypothetical protein